VEVLRDAGYGVYPGEASFVDANTVRVGDTILSAERVLIATGGRTAVPPIPGIDEIEWLDHISALELTEVPESILVVGGGPVGLEFAQIFARFGSRVIVVNHGEQIAARADADAAKEVQAALEDEGIEIVLNATVEGVSRGEAVVAGQTRRVSHVFLASGRVPNVEQLNRGAIGMEVGRGGIAVDGHQRTSVPGIWAVGDVAAGPWFTPRAQ
jgi:pyruvate/2-oxoglutarate dehydrogenase complex dihydrolipoamide dehydrogenase (E3) component